jgi:RimJ/RimL family protein N-acetyltransferase
VERRVTNERVPLDESWLPLTARWLSDPEVARLTMAAPVTPDGQRAWFESLAGRTDYAIWGMVHDGVPVGVMGIKRIGADDGAEYFLYIGERDHWGRGIGAWAFGEVVDEVRSRGLRKVFGVIGKHNDRSLAVHLGLGFEVTGETDVAWLVTYDLAATA